jgi:hypothetical protein
MWYRVVRAFPHEVWNASGENAHRNVAVTNGNNWLRQPPNKQLQLTVTRRRGDAASAPFHYALAPRVTRRRAAAELRR